MELRDLVRGLNPPAVTRYGLSGAIASMAGGSAVPVDVDDRISDVPVPEPEARTALCRHRLWRSVDAGLSWREVHLPAIPDDGVLWLFAGDADTLSIVVRAANGGQVRGYLLTKDGGKSFASAPPGRPSAEAQLANRGAYQMLCPGFTGLEYTEQAENCPQRELVKVGAGRLPSPLVGPSAQATTGPDGRVWLVENEEIRVSSDGGTTWQAAPQAPAASVDEWLPKFSPDGKEVWLHRAGSLYRLDGGGWREQSSYLTGLTNPQGWATAYGWAPLGGGVLALLDDGKVVFSKDGKVSAFPGVAADWIKLLADGSLLAGDGQRICALGAGTGTDRVWTVFQV